MPSFPCPDDCGKTYQSIKAALLCDCDQYDDRGRPRHVKGGDWIE